MFNNIGKKIKTLAKVFVYIGSIACIIFGLIMVFKFKLISGYLYVFLGPFLTWLSSFVLYGFGQLVDNSDKLVELKEISNNNIQNNKKIKTEQIENLTEISNIKDNQEIEEINLTLQYKTAKQIIKNLTPENLNNLKKHYTKWSIEIAKMPIEKLFTIIEKEQNDWEDNYIYLCCFEILNRVQNNK